ncbi:Prostaglandin-endoperoxide synthase [Gloeocapsa sp. PCC 7428]|uniref:peroxidase family protein n=1 Tax=Gloeocapsa sp. PCC 7428 TaxID=1173026 RepID=UPI0002A5C2C8|nr:peroxidase family protein [Gloeocapsa sp. PCC 7428]AFZ30698.1 Prostaglandin-endoperoxide synthase [Gloeocapsa sp. PCC 7428]
MKRRSTAKDGLRNNIEYYVLTHFKWFWNLVQKNNYLKRKINKFLINNAIYKIPTRPYPFSTMAPYTSWDSLTDRRYSGRHLPPVERDYEKLPSPEAIAENLFLRKGNAILSPKSTLLFSYFAQWFTDGFLRTDRNNNLKNTSNHEIDISPLYGLNQNITNILRLHQGGKLRYQTINGEDYPLYYFENGQVREEFKDLPAPIFREEWTTPAQKNHLFAMGNERGNVQIGYVMMNTLFLREHNRICDVLAQAYKDWDDERLFQTARNIVIVLLIKIVIEEYINHITPYHFKFILDPTAFTNEKWYRQNWMTVEFNLLYRWHSLVPDKVVLDNEEIPIAKTQWNNDLITDKGLGILFDAASKQPAGDIGLHNTPHFILNTDANSIKLGRDTKLASYNDYREMCKFPRVTNFNQITEDEGTQKDLKALYGHVDNIEYYVGLFAEDTRPNSALSPLIGRLVGIDAFSQALTNPLLAENVFNEKTFSPIGMKIIQDTQSLAEILHRNIPSTDKRFLVSMTQVN